ncbi:4-hydroxythreonine-4-phosphate dehydrogenase PdxA [Amycolatopsis lurida]
MRLALADDLSGAAEAALALRVTSVHLARFAQESGVVDLDLRQAEPAAARLAVRAAAGAPGPLFLKIDSLLRGNVAAMVRGIRDVRAGLVVCTPALPVAGRATVGGRVVFAGAVPGPGEHRPATVAESLGDLPVSFVDLSAVRSAALPEFLAEIARTGEIAVCDAETDADLDLLAAAARSFPDVAAVGSAGLAAAFGRQLPLPSTPARDSGPAPVLVVVGSAEPSARRQVELLADDGVPVVEVDPDTLEDVVVDLAGGRAVLTVRPGPLDPTRSRALTAHLATTVQNLPRGARLALTGGETARRVLDALGVTRLDLLGQVHPGAVHARTDTGIEIVTRPGSHGGQDSLLAITRHLRNPRSPGGPVSSNLPVIAVTMGDGAGIGPEVIAGALADPSVYQRCRPVVIGDACRLREAAKLLGVSVEVVPVDSPADARFEHGRIEVVDLGLLPADLPWGKLSPVAGQAAYQYVRVAAELALDGAVQAICTAPLNKEALHAAGHLYPGHTEMLAALTGTEEVSMMLSTPKVKVIHVTTHIGLIDAIARIEPGLVERTVRRGHQAMRAAGVAAPVIGVCAINPHAGENGLFGAGEEAEKIEPALEKLRADGIDARGPLPADTAFFLAGRGDYDLIVAMYHDQGHGPVKVLGIEAGVNITVGLPVIRTSVDHGTAFDIAGTGTAEVGSMIEALRQAAELAPVSVG